MGTNNVVILNDIEALKDAFSKDTILARPSHGVTVHLFGATSFVDDSGKVWEEQRRVSFTLLKDQGFGKTSMEDNAIEEIAYLIEELDKTVGKPTNIHQILSLSVSNIINQFIFGHRLEFDDQMLIDMIECMAGSFNLTNPTAILFNIPIWITIFIVRIILIGYGKTFRKMRNFFE